MSASALRPGGGRVSLSANRRRACSRRLFKILITPLLDLPALTLLFRISSFTKIINSMCYTNWLRSHLHDLFFHDILHLYDHHSLTRSDGILINPINFWTLLIQFGTFWVTLTLFSFPSISVRFLDTLRGHLGLFWFLFYNIGCSAKVLS